MAGTTRFAPAPTGYLHLGHVVNAVWVWGYARAHSLRVLLRIEDHDRGRCHQEYEQAILDDLDWLGLAPDGADTATFRHGPHPQRQSDNSSRYLQALEALEVAGRAYPCRCSRADIARAQHAPNHVVSGTSAAEELRYPGTCRTHPVSASETLARRIVIPAGITVHFDDIRLGAQTQVPDRQCGDVLARDRHGNFTYQFCVAVDDFAQGVDHIIRGVDLLSSTGRQFLIAQSLDRATMPRVLHHPLVLHADGRKLSKSAGDTGIRDLRATGLTAAEVLGRAAQLGGLPHDGSPLPATALAQLFV